MSWIELVAQRRPPTAPPGVEPPENAADWYRIENSATEADTTDVYVYDSIGGWFGVYADDFIKDLKAVSTSSINLRINSPGGSVFDGVAIANAIRSHPANVTVYVDGLAASIASVIALAGNKLVMMPQTSFMIHDASGGCYGNAAEMDYMRNLLDKQSDNIASAYAAAAGGTQAEWRARMQAETWYTAQEAVDAGLADEVMPMPKKGDEEECAAKAPTPLYARMQATWDLTAYKHAGREKAPAPAVSLNSVANQFAVDDRVRITVAPHEEGQSAGVVTEVNGNAYGITFDGMEDMGVHHWYTDDELEPENETAEAKVILPGSIITAELLTVIRDSVRQAVHDELLVVEATAVGSHSTSVKAGAWDAGANEKSLPSPVPLATVRKMYTYYDESQVEDGAVPKSACKLPHHFVSDGTPGAASINGVRNALARLPQTQGLSDAERKTAEAHLRAHLNAFSGDEEDHVHDPTAEVTDDETTVTEDAMPAQPDETQEDAPEAQPTDEWASFAARLIESPSPSADDVFNRLKEAWL